MTNKNTGLAGSALLIIGLFTPIVTMPIVGTVNLFNNGTNILAIVVLGLGAIAGALLANDRTSDATWPGFAAALTILWSFGRLEYSLAQMRTDLAKNLQGNPFAGLAQASVGSIQLQWGWLVLAAGAGLVIYAGIRARREVGAKLTSVDDRIAKQVVGASAILLLAAIGWDIYSRLPASPAAMPQPAASETSSNAALMGEAASISPSPEEASYIRDHLKLYDLNASFFDSLVDGRVPGVDFKIKNDGGRTLKRITVRVVFQDASGKPIAEDEFNPVWVTDSSFGDNNTPLRPNYIWQQESGKKFVSKSVPSEWKEGKASAQITHVEFVPS